VTIPLDAWAHRAATLPAALVQATPRAVRAGGGVLELQAQQNLRSAAGGDSFLSRVRSGKGARVSVRLRVAGSGSRSRAEVLPTGPVSLIENDTRPHRQPFSYGTGRRYATAGQQLANGTGVARRKRAVRAGVIAVPGRGVFARVDHPGTRGKHPVGRAFTEAAPEAGRAGAAVFTAAIRTHLT
jgi:hypothetical protein